MATQASGVKPWLTLNDTPIVFGGQDDNVAAHATENGRNFIKITDAAPDDLELYVNDELQETERYGRWLWQPRGFAGLYELKVVAPGQQPRRALLRVLPQKLTYERYVQMLRDIAAIASDLLIRINSPASEKANAVIQSQDHTSALRDCELVKRIFDVLPSVMDAIERSPHRRLMDTTEPRLLHAVTQFSADAQPLPGPVTALPAVLAGYAPSSLPQHWLVQQRTLSYDTPENRLLKHFLWRQLLPRAYSIQERAQREIQRRETERRVKLAQGWQDDETPVIAQLQTVLGECHDIETRCIGWGSAPFLKGVGNLAFSAQPTQVLQKHPHYGRFYRVYLAFQSQLRLSLNTERCFTDLAMRNMAELYETWAVFQTAHIVIDLLQESGYRLISANGFFRVTDDEFQLEVARDANIELAKDDARVLLRYEPTYPPAAHTPRGLVSVAPQQRTPDMSIELWRAGQPRNVIVFDAKYRVQRNDRGEQTYLDEDLDKMDHYMRVICWKPNARQRDKRIVNSAYVLYPGDVLVHDPDEPEVGALPIAPSRSISSIIVNALRDILVSGCLMWSN